MRRILFGIFVLVIFSAATPDARGDGYQGFVYTGGVFTAISVPGASATFASGINDAGQIVGTFSLGNTSSGGFLDNGGMFTTLNIPGLNPNPMIEPAGINDVGQIVGTLAYTTSSNPGYLAAGFVYNGTLLTTIIVTPPYETYANGINNLGQVVGIYCPTIQSPSAVSRRFRGLRWRPHPDQVSWRYQWYLPSGDQ